MNTAQLHCKGPVQERRSERERGGGGGGGWDLSAGMAPGPRPAGRQTVLPRARGSLAAAFLIPEGCRVKLLELTAIHPVLNLSISIIGVSGRPQVADGLGSGLPYSIVYLSVGG